MEKQWKLRDFIFGGSKITSDGDCSHEIERRLLPGRKFMTNLDSILKSRDITLPTKVHLVKAMVFPVVMYAAAAKSLQSCPTLCDPMDCSLPCFSVHGIFPGKSTGVGCHFPLQGIFPTQGLKLCFLHWQANSFPVSHLGSNR